MESLDRQLSDLNIMCGELDQRLKSSNKNNFVPALPPKRSKQHPEVPQSCRVKSACEPSYSTKLRTNATVAYSNVRIQNNAIDQSRKTMRTRSGDVLLYSNLLPPGGTNHIYNNTPVYSTAGRPRPLIGLPELLECNDDYAEFKKHPANNYQDMINMLSVSQQDLATYGGSQISTADESLYEPINPRPSSRLSINSGCLDAPYAGAQRSVEEMDDLDRISNHSTIRPADDGEYNMYCGICYNCGEKIFGETTGCTAMERIYHIKCFRCCQCGINLQGRPFYAANGRALCQNDYMNTLEKCCVCTKPILERILRATGKPYHPQCFACVVCRKSLDGIPFTVDAMNRIHCIEDFHSRYAPRCAICKRPIVREADQEETVRVVALDRSYHVKCYSCEDCRVPLSSKTGGERCYPLDDHILCKSCNAKRIQELTRAI